MPESSISSDKRSVLLHIIGSTFESRKLHSFGKIYGILNSLIHSFTMQFFNDSQPFVYWSSSLTLKEGPR